MLKHYIRRPILILIPVGLVAALASVQLIGRDFKGRATSICKSAVEPTKTSTPTQVPNTTTTSPEPSGPQATTHTPKPASTTAVVHDPTYANKSSSEPPPPVRGSPRVHAPDDDRLAFVNDRIRLVSAASDQLAHATLPLHQREHLAALVVIFQQAAKSYSEAALEPTPDNISRFSRLSRLTRNAATHLEIPACAQVFA